MEARKEFWGVEVKVGQSVKVDPKDQYDGYIRISQVALGEVKKDKATEPVVLYLKIGDRKFVLGTLIKDEIPQIYMDIILDEESELSHNSKNASVWFSGFKVDCSDDVDDFDSDSSDSDRELAPLRKRAQAAKEAAKSGKPAAETGALAKKVKIVDPRNGNIVDPENYEEKSDDESDSDSEDDNSIPDEIDTDNDESDEETPAKKVEAPAINAKIDTDSSDTDTTDSDSDEETPAKKVEASAINAKIDTDSSDTDTTDSDSDEETPAKKVEASAINAKIDTDSSDTDTTDSDSDEETPAKKVKAPQASAPKNATHEKIDTSDSDTTDSSDEETPTKRVDQGKNGKRRNEAGSQTPVPTKKAKNATPGKTDDKKYVHIVTPYPMKKGGKTLQNAAKDQTFNSSKSATSKAGKQNNKSKQGRQ